MHANDTVLLVENESLLLLALMVSNYDKSDGNAARNYNNGFWKEG